jgi:hypothetical protein
MSAYLTKVFAHRSAQRTTQNLTLAWRLALCAISKALKGFLAVFVDFKVSQSLGPVAIVQLLWGMKETTIG